MADILSCFFFYLAVLPLSFDSLALPVTVKKDLGFLTLTLSNVLCENITIGRLYVQYDTHAFNVTIAEDTKMHCFALIETGILGGGNLSLDVLIPAGQNLIVTTNSTKECIVSGATLVSQTLAPQIGNLTQVSGNLSSAVVGLIEKAMGPTVVDMLKTEYQAITAQIANYTEAPLDPLPAYYPQYIKLSELSISELKSLINDLPTIFGARLSAEIPTENSFGLNASLVDAFALNTSFVDINISSNVSLAATLSFQNISCDGDRFDCLIEDGIQLFNIRSKNSQNSIPLINNYIAPTITGLVNGFLKTATEKFVLENTYMSTLLSLAGLLLSQLGGGL